MQVEELMTRDMRACGRYDSLNTAAHIMWEHDCGCVPVVDGEQHVVGMVTDRDVCMAAYTQGQPLAAMAVNAAMAKEVYTCTPEDSVADVEAIMKARQVRRVPVVDAAGRLVGLLSLNDIARRAARERKTRGKRAIAADEIVHTLGAICEPVGASRQATAA